MSVRRAQSEITAREFAEWIALEHLEPTGPERDDMRIGMLAAIVGEALGGKGSGAKVFRHFMRAFDFDGQGNVQRPQQTDDEMEAVCMGIIAQGGAMANG